LVERTNPSLKERLQWARQQEQLAGDARFAAAAEALGLLRPGRIRDGVVQGLHEWDQLDEPQRTALAKTATDTADILRFGSTMAGQIPGSTGCLTGMLGCLAVWSAFFWMPAARELLLGVVIGLAGLAAGAGISHVLRSRWTRRWTTEVLIPEGEKARIDF